LVGAGSVALDLMQRLVSGDGRNFFHGRAAFRERAHLCRAQPVRQAFRRQAGLRRCFQRCSRANRSKASVGAGLCGAPPAHKPDSEPLDRLIRRKGGINACAGRFFRYAGRIKPTRRDSAHSIITPKF
jgi:hypothetical protein